MNKDKSNPRILLSLLWIAIMLLMVFADIFSIIIELENGKTIQIPISAKTAMFIAAVLTSIPITMIVLSQVLPYKINQWANIIVSIFTALYIGVGGSTLPHYLAVSVFELAMLIYIITIALKWRKKEKLSNQFSHRDG